MIVSSSLKSRPLLLLVAGAKGTVASTLAVSIAALRHNADEVLPSLTTGNKFAYLAPVETTCMAGWDTSPKTLTGSIQCQGVVPENQCHLLAPDLDRIPVRGAPSSSLGFRQQVERVMADIRAFKEETPDALPVFINLLPAGPGTDLEHCRSLNEMYNTVKPDIIPDLAYCLAAILSEIPVVNFTPNSIEIPAVINEAVKRGVPVAGRDGKTGQTYLKVVLASALKARNFIVDGWYSLNILGNEDGKNLMDPEKAAGKVANKTKLLDEILGYPVGQRYGAPTHKVHIDYYPPRGDAKEAWDVIDFRGMFDLPMSIRLNLQGRDSILAAPLVLDLGRWLAALQMAGRSGLSPELGFYFKNPVGENPPLTFQDQLAQLRELERECDKKLGSEASG